MASILLKRGDLEKGPTIKDGHNFDRDDNVIFCGPLREVLVANMYSERQRFSVTSVFRPQTYQSPVHVRFRICQQSSSQSVVIKMFLLI